MSFQIHYSVITLSFEAVQSELPTTSEITVLRDVALCNVKETNRRFRGVYSLHRKGDEYEMTSSSPRQEAIWTSETLVSFYKTTWLHAPEDFSSSCSVRESLKYQPLPESVLCELRLFTLYILHSRVGSKENDVPTTCRDIKDPMNFYKISRNSFKVYFYFRDDIYDSLQRNT